MAPKTREVGGGPATGLGNDFVKWLSQGLNTGTFGTGTPAGTDAVGATGGISAYLNDVLSGGAGKLGGAMGEMITKESDRGAAALRARFGVGGGSAFGTPGAYAESLFRSESAPKLATAVGGLQQNALSMLLPLFAKMASKGITQRTITQSENPWMTAGKLGLQGGALAAGFMAGGPPGAAAASSAAGGATSSPSNWILPQTELPPGWA